MLREKLFKGFISAAVVMSMLLPNVLPVNADSDTIHIEGEDGTSCFYDASYLAMTGDPYTTAALSEGKFGDVRNLSNVAFDSEKAIFGYSFNVESDGYYELSFTASKYNNTNYSSYAIAVDDGEFVTVTNGTTVTKTADFDGGVFSTYRVNSNYLLLSGTHTVKFKMLDTGTRSDKRGYVFVDCLDFTKKVSIPGLTINGDDPMTIGNSIVTAGSEGGHPVFKTGANVACPDEGVVVQYTFAAPEEGTYNLTISANPYNGALSTYAVAVNDSEFNNIDASSVTKTTVVDSLISTYETNLNYTVNKGINTIKFKILTGRTSDQRVYCFLKDMQLTKVEEDTIDASYVLNLTTDNTKQSTSASLAVTLGEEQTAEKIAIKVGDKTIVEYPASGTIPAGATVNFGILVRRIISGQDITVLIDGKQINTAVNP